MLGAAPTTENHLQTGHVGIWMCMSGQGSPPSAAAGMLVDKVVASSRASARIRSRFVTVRLLCQSGITRACNLPDLETGAYKIPRLFGFLKLEQPWSCS